MDRRTIAEWFREDNADRLKVLWSLADRVRKENVGDEVHMRGANVVMPNLTPVRYRRLYEIYPAKACIDETSSECRACLHDRIKRIGRTIGKGQGGRRCRPPELSDLSDGSDQSDE